MYVYLEPNLMMKCEVAERTAPHHTSYEFLQGARAPVWQRGRKAPQGQVRCPPLTRFRSVGLGGLRFLRVKPLAFVQ